MHAIEPRPQETLQVYNTEQVPKVPDATKKAVSVSVNLPPSALKKRGSSQRKRLGRAISFAVDS